MVLEINRHKLTNRVGRDELCTVRHEIEEVIKALKDQLSLEACQAGYQRAHTRAHLHREGVQEHHLALCLVAYLVLERKLIVKGQKVALPSLKRVRMAA
jgi:hypothetical protein